MSTPLQSLTKHVQTPSVSHKTCPDPSSLSQNMSTSLQSLTKHVHTPSVSHKTCPESRPLQSLTKHVHIPSVSHKTCPHPFSLSQNMSSVQTPSVSHNTCPHPFSLSQNMSTPLQSLTKHVHTPSVSHKTCPDPLVSHNTRPLQWNSRRKIPLMVCSSSSLTFPCISVITWTMLLMLTLSLYGAPRRFMSCNVPAADFFRYVISNLVF